MLFSSMLQRSPWLTGLPPNTKHHTPCYYIIFPCATHTQPASSTGHSLCPRLQWRMSRPAGGNACGTALRPHTLLRVKIPFLAAQPARFSASSEKKAASRRPLVPFARPRCKSTTPPDWRHTHTHSGIKPCTCPVNVPSYPLSLVPVRFLPPAASRAHSAPPATTGILESAAPRPQYAALPGQRGKGMTSRMLSRPVAKRMRRSKPRPKPLCGTEP